MWREVVTQETASVSEQIQSRLAPYLGDFNAKIWVQKVAQRDLGLEPEALTPSHVSALLDGLRPSLNTFFGRQAAGELLQKILREVR
jgi:hypothetical protein